MSKGEMYYDYIAIPDAFLPKEVHGRDIWEIWDWMQGGVLYKIDKDGRLMKNKRRAYSQSEAISIGGSWDFDSKSNKFSFDVYGFDSRSNRCKFRLLFNEKSVLSYVFLIEEKLHQTYPEKPLKKQKPQIESII